MTTDVEKQPTESERLAALKKQRAGINYQISQLTRKNKNHPEHKVQGRVFYLHNKYHPGMPRVTMAAYVDEKRMEINSGIYVAMPHQQFSKKTGRVRALGKALSTKRYIIKTKQLESDYIREKLSLHLSAVELNVFQKVLGQNPKLRTSAVRSKVRDLVTRLQLPANGTY